MQLLRLQMPMGLNKIGEKKNEKMQTLWKRNQRTRRRKLRWTVPGMLGRPTNRRIRQHVRRTNVERDIVLLPFKNCGHENKEESIACEFCGTLRFDEIGVSGDNQDSEDLFFDDEGI
jgi:hypothetical protein